MSLLSPTQKPVKVYRSTDVGAPALDKSANCVANILKACLVTGYGSKLGAGWTLAFEDMATKSKVLRLNNTTNVPLFLRVYNDTGSTMGVQLVKDPVSANSATKILECSTVFKYLGNLTTGSWAVIAHDTGFWFFAEYLASGKLANRSGAFLFAAIVPATQSEGFVLHHTGGSYSDGDNDRHSIALKKDEFFLGDPNVIVNEGGLVAPMVYNLSSDTVSSKSYERLAAGASNQSPVAISTPLHIIGSDDIYQMPVFIPSRNDLNNFALVDSTNSQPMMNFCTSGQYKPTDKGANAYIPTEYWEV